MQSASALRRLGPALLVAAVATAVYLNTLPAHFTFDDSFAVVYNGDVTDLNQPLSAILGNDFWGQDIRSPMSHKSYRPLTILSFRTQHWLSLLLRRGQSSQARSTVNVQQEGRRHQPEQGHEVRPLIFHLSNVAAHALVTALVYRLARQLAASRQLLRQLPVPLAAAPSGPAAAGKHSDQAGPTAARSRQPERGSSRGEVQAAARSGSASLAAELEPFIAALLFAVHPIHTEAVAGIVGHAELLCAALSIPALLCYMAAADGRVESAAAHWRQVAAALTLGWAAALAKEIGITIMGAMLCYDILLAPSATQLQQLEPGRKVTAPPSAAAPAESGVLEKLIPLPNKQHQPGQQVQQQPGKGATAAAAAAAAASSPGEGSSSAAAVASAASELLKSAKSAKPASDSSSSGKGSMMGMVGTHCSAGVQGRGLLLKLQRMAAAMLAVALYVKARSRLAGDQLVRIYRKVENPIPFADSSLTRKLTAGYLHARYAGLLVAPLQLSADWSYACIEYVSRLSDPRNLATAALYSTLAALVLAARPWEVAAEHLQAFTMMWSRGGEGSDSLGPSQQQQQQQHIQQKKNSSCSQGLLPSAQQQRRRLARWRLAVAAGLLVGPFFPASNVLFYVGTFIGERLLYFPSVGYCILLAQPLAAALQPLLQSSSSLGGLSRSTADTRSEAGSDNAAAEPSNASSSSSSSSSSSGARLAPAMAAALLLGVMLCFFTAKTVLRNRDWLDEERLFIAAQKVCWRSGKVQLNSGIIERRYERYEKAEAHFRLAQAVDPQGFCEPQYHIGLTLVHRNLTGALEYLARAVSCKYTAADAVKALNSIYQQLLQRTPQQAPALMERWAAVLARPELQRFAEAANYLEGAAAQAGSQLQAAAILDRAHAMLSKVRPVPVGRTPEHPVRVPTSPEQLELLTRCLLARRPVILAMLAPPADNRQPARERQRQLASGLVKQVAYRYLQQHGEACRQPLEVPEGADAQDVAARSATYHTALIHALQQADVNDPWLQQEWGLLLVAQGRAQEALPHLEVAGHIFAAQLLPPGQPSAKGLRPGGVLDASGKRPITAGEAAEAAAAAYRHARHAVQSMQRVGGATLEPASRLRVLCHLQQAECEVAQRHVELAASLAQQAQQHGAAARLSSCLAEALALGCPAAGRGEKQPGPQGRRQESARDEL